MKSIYIGKKIAKKRQYSRKLVKIRITIRFGNGFYQNGCKRVKTTKVVEK